MKTLSLTTLPKSGSRESLNDRNHLARGPRHHQTITADLVDSPAKIIDHFQPLLSWSWRRERTSTKKEKKQSSSINKSITTDFRCSSPVCDCVCVCVCIRPQIVQQFRMINQNIQRHTRLQTHKLLRHSWDSPRTAVRRTDYPRANQHHCTVLTVMKMTTHQLSYLHLPRFTGMLSPLLTTESEKKRKQAENVNKTLQSSPILASYLWLRKPPKLTGYTSRRHLVKPSVLLAWLNQSFAGDDVGCRKYVISYLITIDTHTVGIPLLPRVPDDQFSLSNQTSIIRFMGLIIIFITTNFTYL